jgi:Ca2+-binding EF-hand superfamily protein
VTTSIQSKRHVTFFFLLFSLCIGLANSFAQPPKPRDERPGENRRTEQQPRDDRAQIRNLFAQMDKDGDGIIAFDEAGPRLQNLFEEIDANADAGLDKKELHQFMKSRRVDRPGAPGEGGGGPAAGVPPMQNSDALWQRMEQIMKRVDANQDGTINANEVPDQLRERLAPMDGDGDGAITTAEIRQFMQRMKERLSRDNDQNKRNIGPRQRRGGRAPLDPKGQIPKRPDRDGGDA